MRYGAVAVIATVGVVWLLTTAVPAVAAEPPDGGAMRAVASEVPEFAGAWLDEDGTVHIVLTDSAKLDRAHQVLAQADPAFAGPAIAESATYTYNQLEQWHSSLAPVHNVEGVVYTDVDERRNRLVVGTVDVAAHETRIRHVAATGGIPDHALVVL